MELLITDLVNEQVWAHEDVPTLLTLFPKRSPGLLS
jgi:hypothetical protein